MSLFDHLVETALASRSDLAQLRPVVEKELLHHDILRTMEQDSTGQWIMRHTAGRRVGTVEHR